MLTRVQTDDRSITGNYAERGSVTAEYWITCHTDSGKRYFADSRRTSSNPIHSPVFALLAIQDFLCNVNHEWCRIGKVPQSRLLRKQGLIAAVIFNHVRTRQIHLAKFDVEAGLGG